MNDKEMNALIDAAEERTKMYDDDRDCIKTDVMNAFFAGAEYARRVALKLSTDLSHRLRETADQQPGWKPLLTAAADEIERYYGGMMAWKQTAEKKDRDWNEERMARINERCAERAQHIANRALPTAPTPAQTEDLAGAVWDAPNTASQVDPCMALVSKR